MMTSSLEHDLRESGLPRAVRSHALARVEELLRRPNVGDGNAFSSVFADIERQAMRVVELTLASVKRETSEKARQKVPPRKVAYCASYGGFGLSPSFRAFYVERTGRKIRDDDEYDRCVVGALVAPFGKRKAEEHPRVFRTVLAFVKENAAAAPAADAAWSATDEIPPLAKKEPSCFEDAIARGSDGEERVDWAAFKESRFPPKIMADIERTLSPLQANYPSGVDEDKDADGDEDCSGLMEKAYQQFGLQCGSTEYCKLELHVIDDPFHDWDLSEYDGLENVYERFV